MEQAPFVALADDEQALGTLGWVLVVIVLLIVFGFIGFSFNA
jgi:CHASE3 domain sensor protein